MENSVGGAFAGRRCVVTGGLGFIGSNLALALADAGATVIVIDSLVPRHGGNLLNLVPDTASEIDARIEVIEADIADVHLSTVHDAAVSAEFVFNLAGQVSHVDSMADPLFDLHANTASHFSFLELLRRENAAAMVLYTSTRQIFGKPKYLPVDEEHPVSPVDVNGITKYATEQLHLLYNEVYGLRSCAVRLTNVFGPRLRLRDDFQGFLPIFLRLALADESITVFGEGAQERDCLFVDDVVECLLLAALAPGAPGEIFNVGNDEHLPLRAIAEAILEATGSGRLEFVPWPPDRDSIDIGSYFGDSSKAKRVLQWAPTTPFREGIERTTDFYRQRRDWYLSSAVGPSVPFIDLARRAAALQPELGEATARVVASGVYLLGPELEAFEAEFAGFAGRRHAVGVASGTEALRLALVALGVGPGDEVIVPALTAVPTAAAVCATGAVPVFVDVDPDTATMQPDCAAAAKTSRTRAVIPVHLYGRRAMLPDLGVPVLEDAAQAHGALDQSASSAAAAYSFYPTKNLGGIGDGGAVVTDDAELAARVRLLRQHGMTADYVHTAIATNARMSEVEAAALRVGLRCLPAQTERRRDIARTYRDAAPELGWQATHDAHVYHLCVGRVPDRDAYRRRVPFATGVHYPRTLTQQPAYERFVREACPIAEGWAVECVSFPCFPEMTDTEIAAVAAALS